MPVEITVIKSILVEPTFFEKITSTMPEWFQQGGIVMWLLLLTSCLVTTITLERAFTWLSYSIKKEHFAINDCFASLNKGQKEQALIFCQMDKTPALKMLEHGINTLPFSPQAKMDSYAKIQINKLSQGQSALNGAVPVALILGFLGAVLGLIESLTVLSQQNSDTLSSVIGATANALIPLAAALCVTLFAFIPYKLFQNKLHKLQQHLQNVSDEFSYICEQKRLITNQLSEIMKLQEKRINGAFTERTTHADQSEMPYHYEFKEGSDEVNVSLHTEMQDLHKTSQSSIIDMYKNELNSVTNNKKVVDGSPSPLIERYEEAANETQELYGVDEVELQEQQETAHLKTSQPHNEIADKYIEEIDK